MNKNMLIRTIVALIFGPLIIYVSYLGDYWLSGLILLLSALAISEFVIQSFGKDSYFLVVLSILAVVGLILSSLYLSFSVTLFIFVTYFLLIGMLFSLKHQEPSVLFGHITALGWGIAYIGLLYPFVYHIRDLTDSGHWLLYLFGTLWLSDSMAMWIGKGFGKRKLAPTVSPGKTIAGFVGGLAGGIIVPIIMHYWLLKEFGLISMLIGGVLISFVGQLGDLAESCWKRSIGIKDSSNIIPGHGGILDRFDSLLFASPILYFYLKYFIFK